MVRQAGADHRTPWAFVISLDATAVNVALPAIGQSLRGATSGLQWIVDGCTVPFAALLTSAGAVAAFGDADGGYFSTSGCAELSTI